MASEIQQTGQLRSSGIGGSDAGVIIGLNKWKTPVELYLEKITGESDFEGNEATYWGNLLENDVAAAYSERTGNKVVRANQTFRHRDYPWMMAHIDRRVVGQKKGFEAKTALGKFWKPEEWGAAGTDEVPATYIAQCQHYMAVLEWDSWDLGVLLSGPEYRTYLIERNDEFIKNMIAAEEEFWHHVTEKIPPTPKTSEDTYRLFPKHADTSIVATPDIEKAVEALLTIKAESKALEQDAEQLKIEIQNFLGENFLLMSHDGKELLSWKTQGRKTFEWKNLKAAHPELDLDPFFKSGESRILRLKGDK